MPKGIGIFGGAFNPPHNGHVRTAHAILELPFIKELLIVPSFFDKSKTMASYDTRLEMCIDAFYKIGSISICEYKVEYTYQLLSAIASDYKKTPLYFFVGTDWVVDNFKSPDDIRRLCKVIYVQREGYVTGVKYDDGLWELCDNQGDLFFAYSPSLKISSTSIRNLVSKGLSVNGLVPESIVKNVEEAYGKKRKRLHSS